MATDLVYAWRKPTKNQDFQGEDIDGMQTSKGPHAVVNGRGEPDRSDKMNVLICKTMATERTKQPVISCFP